MSQDQWTQVDRYITDLLVPNDPILDAALQAATDVGLPPAHVAPNQGKLLAILAQSIGARSILEIGTLGGYSTIWLARALPPGAKLTTL
jgi:predicted O-methyltransferase YrrM